jgi:hypothetical protein
MVKIFTYLRRRADAVAASGQANARAMTQTAALIPFGRMGVHRRSAWTRGAKRLYYVN